MENSKIQIAIQGYRGAFHDIAAQIYAGEQSYEVVESHDFEGVLAHVLDGCNSHRGMMAIENTLYGSLMNNYQLISSADVWVEGEVFLRIKQNLMAQPGQSIHDLGEVYSHPIAIAQCRAFFEQYPDIRLIETDDTAGSAKMIRDENLKGKGAIASLKAAEIYGLEVLQESIEDNKSNYTRFLALSPKKVAHTEMNDKVSIHFTVDHTVGSLFKVIGGMADVGVNLTKIQSTPIIGHPWEYQFFVDYVMNDPTQFEDVKSILQKHARAFKILGAYKKGERYEH